jgi:hypothetical protein
MKEADPCQSVNELDICRSTIEENRRREPIKEKGESDRASFAF